MRHSAADDFLFSVTRCFRVWKEREKQVDSFDCKDIGKRNNHLRVVWCSRSRSHAPERPWQPLASRLCRMGKRCSSDDSCASRMPCVGRQCVITRPLTVSSNCGGQHVANHRGQGVVCCGATGTVAAQALMNIATKGSAESRA